MTRLRPAEAGDPLTPREIEVLAAYARHGHQGEAALELGMAEATARNHMSAVYAKLGVQNGPEAFQAMGWLRIPDDLAPIQAAHHAQDVIARAELVVAELRELLRASGSDAGSSVHQAIEPIDRSPVAGSADVAVTPAPS